MDQVGFGMRATSFLFQILKNGIILNFSLPFPPPKHPNLPLLTLLQILGLCSLLIVIVCVYVPVSFLWEVSSAN